MKNNNFEDIQETWVKQKEEKDFVEEQNYKYYFVQLITKETTITGVGLTFLVGTEVNVKCVWKNTEDMSIELQNKSYQ